MKDKKEFATANYLRHFQVLFKLQIPENIHKIGKNFVFHNFMKPYRTVGNLTANSVYYRSPFDRPCIIVSPNKKDTN